ncbi:MAG: DUF11 domain-containing protein, partial [Elusimicrobia bacterium]|nr:DUF11 domain-containing protein [Elusimicrobiota bacterium]
AMTRLRESQLPTTARWTLAAAYQLAGVRDAAAALSNGAPVDPGAGFNEGTYPSVLRDQAMILLSAAIQSDYARGKPLAEKISKALVSKDWFDTHSLAYSLVAMSRLHEGEKAGKGVRYELFDGRAAARAISSDKSVDVLPLDRLGREGGRIRVRNPGDHRLYVTLAVKGVPAAGDEDDAAQGLQLDVVYLNGKGELLDVAKLAQGDEITAKVTLTNPGAARLENVALTQLAPSGWEIHNARWNGAGDRVQEGLDYQDVRDDRLYSYLALEPGQAKTVTARFTAAYPGRFYLPAITAEPMYDGTIHARVKGRWVAVERAL